MKKVFIIILTIFLCPPAMASEQIAEPIRVDDFHLTHPFKAGLVKGASLGLYQFSRNEMALKTPYDAQLPIGFESHVRHHGRFAFYTGALLGGSWTVLVLAFSVCGVYLRWRARRSVPQLLIENSQ